MRQRHLSVLRSRWWQRSCGVQESPRGQQATRPVASSGASCWSTAWRPTWVEFRRGRGVRSAVHGSGEPGGEEDGDDLVAANRGGRQGRGDTGGEAGGDAGRFAGREGGGMEGRAGDRAAGGPAGSKKGTSWPARAAFRAAPYGDPRAGRGDHFPGPSQPAKREGSDRPISRRPAALEDCSG